MTFLRGKLDLNKRWNSYSHNSSLYPTALDKKAECDLLSANCYLWRQLRPCCRQPLIELWENGYNEKFVHPIKGELKKVCELGSVWVTCCNAIYGMYYDEETTAYQPVFLGRSEGEAMGKINNVKSFLPFC